MRQALQLLVVASAAAIIAVGLTSRLSPPELQLGRLSSAPALPATTFAGTPPPAPPPAGGGQPSPFAAAATPPAVNPALEPVPLVRPTAEDSGSVPPPAAASQPATFTLVGGTATVSCSTGVPSLVRATPQPGYQLETGTEDGGATLDVRFRSDSHESRLDAWCAAGAVQARVEESSS